jgi:hypothetical protein
MPRPYNRYPLGLLGLLDAKVRGQTPNELGEITQPVVELGPFLLAQGAEVLTDNTAAIAANVNLGAAALLTAPQDEVWYVHAFSARANAVLGAATTVRFQPLHQTALAIGTATAGLFTLAPGITATTGERPASSAKHPIIIAPGDQLGVLVTELILGVAFTMALHAKISRLRV